MYIGDTPEQLSVKLANAIDVIIVGDLTFSKKDIVALQAERDALAAQVEALKNELTLSTDQNDLLLDEFVRVKLLTDNEEIHGLCERAHVRMQQKVSVIDRNFKQAEEIKQLKSQVDQLRAEINT